MGSVNTTTLGSIGVVGASIDQGQPKLGVQTGSDALREGGVNELLASMKVKTTDYGNVTQTEPREDEKILGCKNQQTLIKTSLELKEIVKKSVAENEITFVLGGDHSLALGSISGHCEAFPNTFVVWVDAHADINPPEKSSSGNTHGMPLCFLVEESNNLIPNSHGFEKIKPCIKAKNLLYIGLRDVDTPEWVLLKDYNIRYFSMDDVRELGIKEVMKLTLHAIAAQPDCKIHLSFDIDALDPTIAASTGTPVPGGLSLEDGKLICSTLASTGQLRSVDIAEVNPKLSTPEDAILTVKAGVEMVKSCLLRD